MQHELISICLATYNGEKYIQEQIESLLNQSYQNFEILIQDDNSSDKTVAILQNFQDKRIQIEQNSHNLGYIKNFQKVLSRAKGNYIAICDQDDIWEANKLEVLLENIADYSLIYADSLLIDEKGNSLGKKLSQKLKNNFIDSNQPLNFLYDNTVSAHAALFQAELLKLITPLPKELYFDQYIAMCAASKSGVHYLDNTLVRYRQHSSNTLANNKKTKEPLSVKIAKKVQKKAAANRQTVAKIEELLNLQTLKQSDKELLLELRQIHQEFYKSYFSFKALKFFLQNRDIFFKITQKNPYMLALKKSIGYKLYKAVPLL